jgi:dGTPase
MRSDRKAPDGNDQGQREAVLLAPYALHSAESTGREYPESSHPYRGPFQRDRDRVLHSAAFRRLSGKTQVFTGNPGDYCRTRLTHTMEVASIARTIGRALRLNEDLIEALALLHDIGHPPFGHAGEDALQECLKAEGGFSHNRFALTLVRELEHPYPQFPGLNLTHEVLESQVGRSQKSNRLDAGWLEAQVVDVADSITYDAHDVDDAVQLGLLQLEELQPLPLIRDCHESVIDRFGPLQGKKLRRALVHELIDRLVGDVVRTSRVVLQQRAFRDAKQARGAEVSIVASLDCQQQQKALEALLYRRVYRHPQTVQERQQAQQQLRALFQYLVDHPSQMPARFVARATQVGERRAVADYLAGMTDRYCLQQFRRLVGDANWGVGNEPRNSEH